MYSFSYGLIGRAADVILKERKKLILLPRECPLNEIHLENMLTLSRMGALMIPPVPAFYNHPQTIEDIVNHIVARILDQFNIENSLTKRWHDKSIKVVKTPNGYFFKSNMW